MDKKIFKVKGTYVNGQWLNSKDRYDIYNPSNGEKLSDVPISCLLYTSDAADE